MKTSNHKTKLLDVIDTPCYNCDKMDLLLKEVGSRVKKERLNQHLSVAELAELAKLNTSNIYKIEAGESNIGLKSLLKVSIVLQKSVGDFIPIEEVKDQKKNGEKFEELTKELTLNEINYIFRLIEGFIELQTRR